MSYAQKIIDKQSGQTSQLSSEKNPLGTYARLLDVRSKNGELEFIGGSLKQIEVDNAVRFGNSFFFEGREFVFYVREDETDSDIEKTFLAEMIDGVFTDLEDGGVKIRYTLTRDPSVAIAPDAFFATFGDTVEKFKIVGGDIDPSKLTGASNVIAICFGQNRIFGIAGKIPIISDMVAGGDVTTFNTGDGWTDGGRFPSTLKRDGTNIEYTSGKVVVFSPSEIEVKILSEIQRDNGTGVLVSEKKTEEYGEIKGVGTSTFRQLAIFGEFIYFVDENTKKFYRLIPQKDQDGRIFKEEITLDSKNFKKLEFDTYLSFYSNKMQAVLVACKSQSGAFNDLVVVFDPEDMTFSQKKWAVSSFSEDVSGSLYFTKDNEAKIMQYDEGVYTEDESASVVEIEMNDFSDPQFWKKLKVKKLAFWLVINPDAKLEFFQSIDGGDFQEVDLKTSPILFQGSFVSPRSVLGRTAIGASRRQEAEDIVSYVIGKAKVKAKGTTVRYLMRVHTDKKFIFKSWAITNYRTVGKKKFVNIRVRN